MKKEIVSMTIIFFTLRLVSRVGSAYFVGKPFLDRSLLWELPASLTAGISFGFLMKWIRHLKKKP